MTKKLTIFLIAVLTVASLGAQPAERSGSAVYAPRKGQVQVNAVLGNGYFFNQGNSLQYLQPSYLSYNNVGLEQQLDGENLVGKYLQMGDLNNNSLSNIAGIQAKYFVTDRLAITSMFSMDLGLVPQRDYVDAVYNPQYNHTTAGQLKEAGINWVEGTLTNKYFVNVGTEYYFNNCNGRLFPYVGVVGGFQHARIQALLPYTGLDVNGNIIDELEDPLNAEDIEYWMVSKSAGEAFAIPGALTFGVEYNFLPGMNVALEVRPFNYYYSVIQMVADGYVYQADMHQFKFFAFPQLKFGFRF